MNIVTEMLAGNRGEDRRGVIVVRWSELIIFSVLLRMTDWYVIMEIVISWPRSAKCLPEHHTLAESL